MSNTSCSSFDHTEHLGFIVVPIKPGIHQLPSIAGLERLREQWPSLQMTMLSQKKLLAHIVSQHYFFPEKTHFEMGFEDIDSVK